MHCGPCIAAYWIHSGGFQSPVAGHTIAATKLSSRSTRVPDLSERLGDNQAQPGYLQTISSHDVAMTLGGGLYGFLGLSGQADYYYALSSDMLSQL